MYHYFFFLFFFLLLLFHNFDIMNRLMSKPTICICENKDADQLHGNREADQRLCFCYTDSTLHMLLGEGGGKITGALKQNL